MSKPEARWSEQLRRATMEAIEEFAIMPVGDEIGFKHIVSGYGIVTLADLSAGKLRMTHRTTGQDIVFADAEALIDAGWAID